MGRPKGSKYFSMVKKGKKFVKWTVIGFPFTDEKGMAYVECSCDCTLETNVRIESLVNGKSTQCIMCSSGITDTAGGFSNRMFRTHVNSVRNKGLEYTLDEAHLSESFSIQSQQCALSGESLTFRTAEAVPYDSSVGLTPENTVLVSGVVKGQMGDMDVKSFVNLCQTVVDNSMIPKEAPRKNMTVRDFFDRRDAE